jgi:integrase
MPTLIRPRSQRKGQPAVTSAVWHIRYRCPARRRSVVISTRCRSRRNAEKCLAEFVDLLERGEVGLENPFLARREQQAEAVTRLAVASCLEAFEADLRAGRVRKGKRKAVSTSHADLTLARVRRVLEGCAIGRVTALSADAVNALLDRLQASGEVRTAQTRKHYERAIKSFSRWLAAAGRLERDPLGRLEVTHVDAADVVHDRGAFTPGEIEAIAAAARPGPAYRGLSVERRALLYLFAASTGLRAKECAAVRKRDFGAALTLVRVAGEFTKNSKEAVQPVPSFLRPALGGLLEGLGDDDFLWPGGWAKDERGRWAPAGWVAGKDAGELLRRDAARAGIAIGRAGREANGGRVLDFHSLRHSYVSALDRAGLSEGLARKLARASSRAILERYTHREFAELAEAVEALPAIAIPAAGADSAASTAFEPHALVASHSDPSGPNGPGLGGGGRAGDGSLGAGRA